MSNDQANNRHTGKILMVLTSHADLGGVRPTGLYVSEAAEPWGLFTAAGYQVDVVSVAGGRVPLDGYHQSDPLQRAFVDAYDLTRTPSLDGVDPTGYDAVFFPGGHGTMWDFPTPQVGRIAAEAHAAGVVVAAVCHGPAALAEAVTPEGRPLVEGRRVAGFSNEEEAAAGLTDALPFLLQDRLAGLGGRYESAPKFTEHVVVDGLLVTGQNPQSARAVARAVIEQLGRR